MGYYIIGSKYEYETKRYNDVFPTMLKENSLCVGYASHLDLTKYYGKSQKEIVKFLKSKNESPSSYNALKKYLSLTEGDLVAIKSFSAPLKNEPRLVISAIGIVASRKGRIYKYEPNNYGHRINIEFLEKDINKEYKLGYGQTVHKVSNIDHIKQIFSNQIDDLQESFLDTNTDGVTNKNIDDQLRKINTQYIADAYHNRIQNKLYDLLVNEYGITKVKMELDYIDVLVTLKDKAILYEVKPYENARPCFRSAVGQLIEYSWFKKKHFPNRKIKLVIVGPEKLSSAEKKYFNYLKKITKVPLEYRVVK